MRKPATITARLAVLAGLLAFQPFGSFDAAAAGAPDGATITPGVPDLPPPSGCACADSALANVVKYFSEKGFDKLGKGASGNKLTDSELVREVNKRDPGSDPAGAARQYIKDKGYQDKLQVHVPDNPTFENIVAELKKGQLVLLNLQAGTVGPRHTVTVVGWSDKDGVKQIGIHDINAPPAGSDHTGSTADGTDFYKIETNAEGFRFDYGVFPFRTVSIVAISPAPPAKDASPTSKVGTSTGKSVHYDPITTRLTFTDDLITGTGFPGDPLVGVEVSPPAMELISTDPATRTALFRPAADALFRLQFADGDVMQASLPQMRYDGFENRLVADLIDVTVAGAPDTSPLFNPALPDFNSPWLDHIGGILDPASPAFQPDAILHLTYQPNIDLWDATNGFTGKGDAEITNGLFTQRVPEPTTMGVMLIAFFGLWAVRGTAVLSRRSRS